MDDKRKAHFDDLIKKREERLEEKRKKQEESSRKYAKEMKELTAFMVEKIERVLKEYAEYLNQKGVHSKVERELLPPDKKEAKGVTLIIEPPDYPINLDKPHVKFEYNYYNREVFISRTTLENDRPKRGEFEEVSIDDVNDEFVQGIVDDLLEQIIM